MILKIWLAGLVIAAMAAGPSLAADASAGAPAVTSAVATAPERILSLNGRWSFRLARDQAESAALAQFHQPDFDAGQLQTTSVPSNWAMQGFETPVYGRFKGEAAEGYYLRRFALPAGWKGERVLLHFGGVWASAEVWLNGKALGRHDSGFTAFAHDITPHLAADGENVLAVRVRQAYPDYLLDTNDDWSLGGIYRDVWLESTPRQRWLDRVEVRTVFDDQYRDADLQVRMMVGDTQARPSPGNFQVPGGTPYRLRLTLLDAQGREVMARSVDVPGHAGTGRDTGVTLHVPQPLRWTAETPHLYRLRVDLMEQGGPAHQRELNIGFRQVSTAGGVLRVNGQAVRLRGVNRHEEHPDVGRATTPQQWLEDLTLMKAANINYIRLAHYPPAQGFLDLCDRMGMYVSDEIPMGYGGDQLHDPGKAGAVMLRSQPTVARDINHPSVIIWSIGNEDPLTSLHLAAIRTVKGLDPTRPVLMPWRAESWLPPEVDIQAPHYFDAAKNDELAAGASRPIVTTEFSHAYGNEAFGGLEQRWKALTRHPAGAGGAIWMWADQGLAVGKPRPGGGMATELALTDEAFDGIVDSYRKPTRDYWETKAVYAPVRLGAEQLRVAAGQAELSVPVLNDHDFTDLGEIAIGWRLYEDDKLLAEGTARTNGAPHASAAIEVPLAGLERPRTGASYSIRLNFRRADGGDIGTQAAELLMPPGPALAPSIALSKPLVETGELVTVRAGKATYVFNPRSGELVSAAAGGEILATDLKPALWRQFNPVEQWIAGWSKWGELPDLNAALPAASRWQVAEGPDGVELTAVVDYTVDKDNSYKVDYSYQVTSAGELRVRYRIEPKVKARWLPYVGMQLRRAPSLERLRWLGLGPYDTYPNKQAAGIFGVWSAALDGTVERSTKRTRWIELSGYAGAALRVWNTGYVDFNAGDARQVRILSAVRGLPSKGRVPEDESQRLQARDAVFCGEFSIVPAY